MPSFESLSTVEKWFIGYFAVTGVFYFLFGEKFFSDLILNTNASNLATTALYYYLLDPLVIFLIVVGYTKFDGLKGALSFLALDVSYDLMFYKGPGTFGHLLVTLAPIFGPLSTVLFTYVLPLSFVVGIAVLNPDFFDDLFGLNLFNS